MRLISKDIGYKLKRERKREGERAQKRREQLPRLNTAHITSATKGLEMMDKTGWRRSSRNSWESSKSARHFGSSPFAVPRPSQNGRVLFFLPTWIRSGQVRPRGRVWLWERPRVRLYEEGDEDDAEEEERTKNNAKALLRL